MTYTFLRNGATTVRIRMTGPASRSLCLCAPWQHSGGWTGAGAMYCQPALHGQPSLHVTWYRSAAQPVPSSSERGTPQCQSSIVASRSNRNKARHARPLNKVVRVSVKHTFEYGDIQGQPEGAKKPLSSPAKVGWGCVVHRIIVSAKKNAVNECVCESLTLFWWMCRWGTQTHITTVGGP